MISALSGLRILGGSNQLNSQPVACLRHVGRRPTQAGGSTSSCEAPYSGVYAETPMRRIRGPLCKLRLTQMDECFVVTSLQIDLRLPIDALVDDHIESIAFANRRNGAVSAVPKQLIDLFLAGEDDPVPKLAL